MSIAIIIACLIHYLYKKNYDILYQRPFSQTWPKTHIMLGLESVWKLLIFFPGLD